MESLFVPVGNRTPITKDTDLYVICKRIDTAPDYKHISPVDYVLLKVDNRFYRSRALENLTVILSADILQPYNHFNLTLKPQMTVTVLRGEYYGNLPTDSISNMKGLIAYLKFAESVRCNITSLLESVAFDGFFVDLMRRNLKIWNNNKILLTAMNYKDYSKLHFTSNAGDLGFVGAVAGYPNNDPVNNPKLKKSVIKAKYEPIPKESYDSFCTQEDFNWTIEYLVNLKADSLIFRIFQTMLLSIEHCHIALKCPYLQDIIRTYPLLSTYLIYAMRIMYLEERAKYGYGVRTPTLTDDERILFRLDEVVGLPFYTKFTYDCPYFVEPGYGLASRQGLILPALIKGTRGIYDRETALSRLSKYTDNILKNLRWRFESRNGVQIRTVLCGSAIPAIFVKNPLEEYSQSTESYWQEYYPAQLRKPVQIDSDSDSDDGQHNLKLYTVEESDGEDESSKEKESGDEHPSEIDSSETSGERNLRRERQRVLRRKAKSAKNNESRESEDSNSKEKIGNKENNKEDEEVKLESMIDVDSLIPATTDEIARAHAHMEKILGWKLNQKLKTAAIEKAEDIANEGDNEAQQKTLAQRLLNTIPFVRSNDKGKEEAEPEDMIEVEKPTAQAELINEFTSAEKLANKYTDIDLMVETNDYEAFDEVAHMHFETIRAMVPETYHIYMKPVLTENKYKYRIYGLTRNVEIFMVDSIPATISKFHLAPVRAWWDGEDLHMLPTFVIAAMSGMSYDLRWISCMKDLRDVVLKYFQRGFGTVINKKEAKNIIEYVNNSDQWPAHVVPARLVHRWRAAQRWARCQIYCNNTAIFNPSQYNIGIWYGLKCDSGHVIRELEWTIRKDDDGAHELIKPVSRSRLNRRIKDPEKINKSWIRSYVSKSE